MPTKPTKEVIEASKKKLDPRAILEAVLNDTPELAKPLMERGLVEKVED